MAHHPTHEMQSLPCTASLSAMHAWPTGSVCAQQPTSSWVQGMSIVPSMGMAWYLAAEAFPSTLQVCHAALLLVPWLALLPLAVCLHQEPLLLWALAALGGCLFAPSPKSTDLLRCLVSPASHAVSASAVGLARWPSINTKHGGWIRLELRRTHGRHWVCGLWGSNKQICQLGVDPPGMQS